MKKIQFEKWLGIATQLEHENERGNEDDLYDSLTRYLIEHVMVSLYAKNVVLYGSECLTNVEHDIDQLNLIPENKDKLKQLAEIYVLAECSERNENPPINPPGEPICNWHMGCSVKPHPISEGGAIQWERFRILGHNAVVGTANMQPIFSFGRELVFIEKDHSYPKSKIFWDWRANGEYPSQWLCKRHNKSWKSDLIAFSLGPDEVQLD